MLFTSVYRGVVLCPACQGILFHRVVKEFNLTISESLKATKGLKVGGCVKWQQQCLCPDRSARQTGQKKNILEQVFFLFFFISRWTSQFRYPNHQHGSESIVQYSCITMRLRHDKTHKYISVQLKYSYKWKICLHWGLFPDYWPTFTNQSFHFILVSLYIIWSLYWFFFIVIF